MFYTSSTDGASDWWNTSHTTEQTVKQATFLNHDYTGWDQIVSGKLLSVNVWWEI